MKQDAKSKEVFWMENTNENRPEKKFRAAGVSATVWRNSGQNKDGEPISYRTISIERNYKDKNGEWKSTNSFRTNDLPKVALVSNKAYEYILMADKDMSGSAANDNDSIEEEIVM
jgi:hypothetical protein